MYVDYTHLLYKIKKIAFQLKWAERHAHKVFLT